jgi:hypothetical protein
MQATIMVGATATGGVDARLILYLVSAALFCFGYFAPWVSMLGKGVGGLADGLEMLGLVAGAIAAVLAIVEAASPSAAGIALVRGMLSASCLAFAVGELTYWALAAVGPVRLGFGLPLLVAGAIGMAAVDLGRLPLEQRPLLLLVGSLALAGGIGTAGWRGYHARQEMARATEQAKSLGINFNANGAWATPGTVLPFAAPEKPKNPYENPRPDVEVKVNRSYQTPTLTTSSFGTQVPYPAGDGKVFLVCNVTVTYKGNGSEYVYGGNFRLLATNRQIYSGDTVSGILGFPQGVTPISAHLLPAGTASGDVIFRVDAGAQLGTVQYSD